MRPSRLAFLLTVLLLLTTALTGCAGGSDAGRATPVRTADANAGADSATPAGKTSSGRSLRLAYMPQAGYPAEVVQERVRAFEAATGARVTVSLLKYDEQHERLVTSMASPDPAYDVVPVNLVWVADFADRGYILPLDDRIGRDIKQEDIAPAFWQAFSYQGKTWAMPFDAGLRLLYYNREMLAAAGSSQAPRTLEDLEQDMQAVKERGIVQYPWTGAWSQRESLVSDFVWLTGAYGGDTFDAAGKPVFNQAPGLKAMETMVRWISEGLVDAASLNQDEVAVKDAFLAGKAAFTSNGSFQYSQLAGSLVAGKTEIAVLPVAREVYRPVAAGSAAGASGAAKAASTKAASAEAASAEATSAADFTGLAVAANSRERDLAWELIQWLTAPEFQARHPEELSVWTSVQNAVASRAASDQGAAAETAAGQTPAGGSVIQVQLTQLAGVRWRPQAANYAEVTSIMQRYIHLALEKRLTPKAALDQAAREIQGLN